MSPVQLLALVVLGSSVAFVGWAYAGYPLLVAILARLRLRLGPARVAPGLPEVPPDVTIVIVVHDAAHLIERKLLTCLAQDYPAQHLQVLVYSDGSTDGIAARMASRPHPRVRLLEFPARRGKAACINDALAACTTPIVVMTDVRQTLDPSAVRHLVARFSDPAVAAVSGALEIAPARGGAVVRSAGVYWRMEKKLRAAEAVIHSSVGVTGALYAMRRTVFERLPAKTILDDVLVPMNAVLAGWRVEFEPRSIAYDEPSDSAAQERARKVRTLAGNFQLPTLRPALLNPLANPIWFQFLSHKIARVLAPFALLAALLATAVLATTHWFFGGLLAAQLGLYAFALVPEDSPLLRALGPLRTLRGFLSLQGYAVVGLVWLLRHRQPQFWNATVHDQAKVREP